MVNAMWHTGHTSLNEAEARRLRRFYDGELVAKVRSTQLADDRARVLAPTGGRLPAFPTVNTSLTETRRIRDHHIHYPPSQVPSSGVATRKVRSLPVRGPNMPLYWVPTHNPPKPGTTSASDVGAHTRLWGGLYNELTYDVNFASARGQASLARLREHHTSLPFVPSQHQAAAPVVGYSSPYRAEHRHRPMVESGQIGAFHHCTEPDEP